MAPRYIFICGGVMSGIGKGTSAASIGLILKSKGFSVEPMKIDPYLNVDAGTMNPIEHGEVFVTKDGIETDQDIGIYERFLDQELERKNYLTSGQVYWSVLNKERNFEFGGKCVEIIPHATNEVISRIKELGKKADFVLVEIGGTVGEYQNLLFLEAARQMKLENPKRVIFILVSYLPIPEMLGEMKTKPTQTAARLLNEAGIQPNFVLARARVPLDEPRKRKISLFCNVEIENVISAPDIKFLYEIPLNFEKENLGNKILKKFGLKSKKQNLRDWQKLVETIKTTKKPVKIGIVGKYFETGSFTLMDSYISVIEAIKHAAWYYKRKPEISWLSAGEFEVQPSKLKELKDFDGIIVPGGFGNRGIEGKIKAIEFCRENKIPYLGLCLGMQLAVVEFARNVCNLKGANSTEFDEKTKYPIIDILPEQKFLISQKKYGGTMRLGDYKCQIKKGTKSWRAYGQVKYIFERHRHRYELNNKFRNILESKGMVMAGINPERNLVEIIELKNHPFFVACQFHPEFKSRPLRPHPLFKEFIRASIKNATRKNRKKN
jgi:CTP synthase